MLFNSFEFLIFFPVVTAVYFGIAFKMRWIWLLFASCFFYMFFIPYYILILAFTIIIDYFSGILIEKTNDAKRKKLFLIISIISNIGILGIFKYYNFFIGNFYKLFPDLEANLPIPYLEIILPIGLSFHTFQALSYIIEVYRGKVPAEKHFGIYALYVMFYPQLVAGPIERPQNVIHQFRENKTFDYQRVTDGLKLMAWGLFKKVVIADRLAAYVNEVYNNPGGHHGFPIILATYFFAIQIYCDFSGYSDIALGSAKVMGYDLMQNFQRPYFSKSIAEFWRRWHISLSTWFKDYVYIPLGGNKVSEARKYINILIVFLLSGLWHGANWTYVIWGALHGFYQIIDISTRNFRARFLGSNDTPYLKIISIFITFHLVAFAWIFFRAKSIGSAFTLIRNMFTNLNFLHPSLSLPTFNYVEISISLAVIILLFLAQFWERKQDLITSMNSLPNWVRWPTYHIIGFSILFLGKYDEQQFIYFQF